jgi:hypothetical protein
MLTMNYVCYLIISVIEGWGYLSPHHSRRLLLQPPMFGRGARGEKSAEKLLWHGGNSIARTSRTSPVYLVDLVCFVHLVGLV